MWERADQISSAIIAARIVVLEDRVGNPAVQVETSSVFWSVAAVVVGAVELNRDRVRVPGPDSDRPADSRIAKVAIMKCRAPFDRSGIDIREDDAAAAVFPFAAIEAGVVVCGGVSNVDVPMCVLVSTRPVTTIHIDAGQGIVVCRRSGDAHVAKPALPEISGHAHAKPEEAVCFDRSYSDVWNFHPAQ